MPRSIILLRHAERLDRALEQQGGNWIFSASRPQDSPLSPFGIEQAIECGKQLRDYGICKIFSSPMIRTMQTSKYIAQEIGISFVNIEPSLIEEAKSFRGKHQAQEPTPVWSNNKLYLSPDELLQYCECINLEYVPFLHVDHVVDEHSENHVREVHPTLQDAHDITRARCQDFMSYLVHSNDLEVVLCVGHGATCSGCADALQKGLPAALRITGTRAVSSWAAFVPYDESDPLGPWYAPNGKWNEGGNILVQNTAAECVSDQG
jgi:broad specificity phosphatase PhoE